MGIADFGLLHMDALAAIELAREEGLPILGGDVFRRRLGTIDPIYANWHTDPSEGESGIDFARRSWEETIEYINRFQGAEQSEILFVLVRPI